jgi:16S rRNA (cytidine1402-2'-O)-methyltransferase
MAGTLFIVSTPIGNLADFTERAREVLAQVDVVAAEDTRTTGRLLDSAGVRARLLSYHDHNEESRTVQLLERLLDGDNVALVSDAGTPLISDPGYRLVKACHEAQVPVVPVPGASALLAALVVAGLPTDRFLFAGFLPAKGKAREQALEQLAAEPVTTVVYESPRRLVSLVEGLCQQCGGERQVVLCRELTKRFETVISGSLADLAARLAADSDQLRGEMVLVLSPAPAARTADADLVPLARLLLAELPVSRAARVLAQWTGRPRAEMYRMLEAL